MKQAIVLSGGGTKGAYELGVWRLLNELRISYDIVTGTSIGSINGALMVTRDYEQCEQMWENLTMEDMMVDGITLANSVTDTMEDFYNQKQALRPYLKKYLKNKGLDNSPFTDFIEKQINEEKVRASSIDYGLVTVQFPSLTPFLLSKDKIPEGLMKDYIIASSSVFPAFPMHKIGEETYVDGCYYDNLPIDLAVKMGAHDIIAVDLHTTPQHPNHFRRPYVKTIMPTQDLGGVLDFDKQRIRKNIRLGYMDAQKAYGKLKGFTYYFTPESVDAMEKEVRKFCYGVATGEALMMQNCKSKLEKAGDVYRMFHLFEQYANNRTLTKEDYFIRGAEICGDIFGMDQSKLYDLREFAKELHDRIGSEDQYPDRLLFETDNQRNEIKRLSELKMEDSSVYLTGCLYHAMKSETLDLEKQMNILVYLPHEVAAVLFLQSIE